MNNNHHAKKSKIYFLIYFTHRSKYNDDLAKPIFFRLL